MNISTDRNASDEHRLDIILIGPCGSGKSTVGGLLAAELGIPSISMDNFCQRYYAEAPKPQVALRDSQLHSKFPKWWLEGRWKDAYALDRLLSEHKHCVFDLGAGHSVYEDDDLFVRAENALRPYDNIVLLMPSSDPVESIRILRERTLEGKNWDCVVQGFDFHEHFVKHHSNYDLAKYVVYTMGKTPAETRDEILALTRRGSEQSRCREPSLRSSL